ncbi:MAG: hypothetical protein ACRCY4_05310 [Brevinema sp.]
MKVLLLSLFLLLGSCSTQDLALKNEWIANITDKTLYSTDFVTTNRAAVTIDKSSGDMFAGGRVYRFNEARSAVSAVYTMQTGTYVGIILTENGLMTAQYTDATTTPSQGKNNLDFNTPQYTLATYTP